MPQQSYVNRYKAQPPFLEQHFRYLRNFNPQTAEAIDSYFERVMFFINEIQKDLLILSIPPGPERELESAILNLDKVGGTASEIRENTEKKEKYIRNIESSKDQTSYGASVSYLPLIFHEACLRSDVQDAIESDVEYQRDCADLLYAMQALTYAEENVKNAVLNIKMAHGMPIAENGELISPRKLLKMDNRAYPSVARLFDIYGYTLAKEELHETQH